MDASAELVACRVSEATNRATASTQRHLQFRTASAISTQESALAALICNITRMPLAPVALTPAAHPNSADIAPGLEAPYVSHCDA